MPVPTMPAVMNQRESLFFTRQTTGPSHLKVSVEITLPLIPSHQGRGNLLAPSPLGGEGWGEGAYKIKCEGPLLDHDISF